MQLSILAAPNRRGLSFLKCFVSMLLDHSFAEGRRPPRPQHSRTDQWQTRHMKNSHAGHEGILDTAGGNQSRLGKGYHQLLCKVKGGCSLSEGYLCVRSLLVSKHALPKVFLSSTSIDLISCILDQLCRVGKPLGGSADNYTLILGTVDWRILRLLELSTVSIYALGTGRDSLGRCVGRLTVDCSAVILVGFSDHLVNFGVRQILSQ